MAFKDRLRKALSRSSMTTRSNSSASSTGPHNLNTNTLNPTPTNTDSSTLTPTTTTSRLSKRLTWRSDKSPSTEKKNKKIEDWDDRWEVKPHKQKTHEMLKGFEWKWRTSLDGRRSSSYSAVSPMASRVGSVDDGHVARRGSVGRQHSGVGPMERSRSNGEAVGTVIEE